MVCVKQRIQNRFTPILKQYIHVQFISNVYTVHMTYKTILRQYVWFGQTQIAREGDGRRDIFLTKIMNYEEEK